MPQKSTRHWAKRKLASARGGIDSTGQHIYAVSEIYRKNHPEISKHLDIILGVLAELEEQILVVERDI